MKQFFHDLFYLPKHEKLTDRSFMKIVISSIAGITLCCLCLVSLTWAWFEDGVSSSKNVISSASFWADVYIEKVNTSVTNDGESGEVQEEPENDEQAPDENNGGEVVVMRSGSPYLLTTVPVMTIENSSPQFPMTFNLEGSYTLMGLEAGKYKITVYPRGTAKKVGGYIVIKAEGKDTLYTEQLKVDEEFVFTFTVDGTVSEYEFYCVWGSLPFGIEEKNIFKNELDEKASDKAISADSSDTSSDVGSIDESSNSIESEAVVSSDESTSSAESEGVSSAESEVVSSVESDAVTSSAESTSSTESDVTSSIDSDVVSSEKSTDSSAQENTEEVDTEENSSEF